LQTGLSQWGADLDALVQLPQVTAIEWNGRVLRLTRRGSASASEGIRVVGWTRRDGQWMRWQSPALYARDEVEQAWQQADRWSQNPGDEERRYEVAVAPLQDWQVFYFRGDSWTNPLSSDAVGPAPANPFAAAIAAAAGPTARLTVVPDGVRVVLVLPEGGALSGRIVRDWVSPKVGGGKS